MSGVSFDTDGHTAIIRLDRPEARNALSQDMRQQMFEFFKEGILRWGVLHKNPFCVCPPLKCKLRHKYGIF